MLRIGPPATRTGREDPEGEMRPARSRGANSRRLQSPGFPATAPDMARKELTRVDGRELSLSSMDKVYFPESGFTKGEVIAYYEGIAEFILPHLRDRPLTLKRYPEGIHGEHFYEKNAPSHTPAWVETLAVPRSEGGPDIRYILCNDRATLLWVTNLGDIEKHVLLARAPDVNRPTSIVFDLDPGEPATLLDCGRVALRLRDLLQGLGLESFVKVSGSKGLHLGVPLNGDVTYETTQPFAKTVAELARQEMPDLVVSEMAKSLRRGKVLIDWSQNTDFKTTVCVYALRARPGGPFVSMPVTWDELARAVRKKDATRLVFTPEAALKRARKLGDLFRPLVELRQELPTAFTEALAAGPAPRLASWPRNRSRSGSDRDRSLREYAAKRDHSRTPEPKAGPASTRADSGVHRFVIQKHQARQLHYDFRLEMGGVLRSWAVPKGPPTQLRETRLAMHVEDHPLEYAEFEGTIPEGNYGAGTVMIWDFGEYEDLTGDPAAAFHAGKMHLILRGSRLQGEWILVKDRRDQEGNRWLLIKAGEAMEPLPAPGDDRSAATGRSMAQITETNDAQWQSNRPASRARRPAPARRSRSGPAFVEPMQCRPVTSLPADSDWSYEIKFDGYRCIAVKVGGEVTLRSRRSNSLNDRFPSLVEALAGLRRDFTVDGEIVALDDKGRPSFQLLQDARPGGATVYFYAFDLLHDGSESLLSLPLERRRERLMSLFSEARDPVRISAVLQAPAAEVLAAIRRLGLEGVIGKRIGSVYEPGERSGAWIKHRTDRQQEFVIGGYVPGTHGFEALLVGVHEAGQLRYVARVRNGFVARIRKNLLPMLEALAAKECPFANLPESRSSRWGEPLTAEKMKACRWVKPELVCQVGFVEWTEGGRLRHASFLALRDDKDPADVVRET